MQTKIAELQHRLKGFSGCGLEVFRVDERTFVRKTARHPRQNAKLLAECSKLERLRTIASETGLFRVPDVIGCETTSEGLTFYDILFVPGWELDSRLAQMPPREVDRLAFRMFEIIKVCAQIPANVCCGLAEFSVKKLHETARALNDTKEQLPSFAEALLVEFTQRINNLNIHTRSLDIPSSFCHGDLALDNVLIGRNGELYLIDPLVNGYECYVWDVAKVFQSCLVRWKTIKHGEFQLHCEQRKIRIKSSDRVALFNAAFASVVTELVEPRLITLFLAVTVARAAKYWKTVDQLCALLLIAIELLDRFTTGKCDLDESLSTLRW